MRWVVLLALAACGGTHDAPERTPAPGTARTLPGPFVTAATPNATQVAPLVLVPSAPAVALWTAARRQ